ncbi:MAG: hypothetical protein NZ555_16625, partial [Geminicoccaceae bacterium]|nr:hypothetical protein [Geminicoccaceae bacterium]
PEPRPPKPEPKPAETRLAEAPPKPPAKPEPAKPVAKAEPPRAEPPKPQPPKPEPPKPVAKVEPARPQPAKPEPAKAEPPKPEPAKPAAKSEPAPTRPKPEAEDSFAALLKSVEKLERRVQAERASPGQGRAESRLPEARGTALRADQALTQGEIDAIRRQIERCWNVPVGVRGIETMQVRLRIAMNRDGSVARVGIEDQARMAVDPAFRTVAESAQRAVLSCQLTLPPEKYEQWREMVMTFHPKDALSG